LCGKTNPWTKGRKAMDLGHPVTALAPPLDRAGPLPDGALQLVARGVNEDPAWSVAYDEL
jgi:hypothetical protein